MEGSAVNGMTVSLWCDECADPRVGCRATDCALRTAGKEELFPPDGLEREDLIGRLIEADEALFANGDAISHRDAAEAALRVVEDYIRGIRA